MTDKTKPWASANHPEVIACKAEAKKLYEQLSQQGADLTGVGVGTTDDNQQACIQVYLRTEMDEDMVPATFNGYEVKTVVTGDIIAQ